MYGGRDHSQFYFSFCYCCLITQSCLTLWYHGRQHARLPCPSLSPGVCSDSCSLSWGCHQTISCCPTPFSSCLQSFPESGSFPVSKLFPSGGQSIGASASASVIPMNIQSWFPLVLTGLISLQSKGPLRVFPSAAVLSPRDVQLPQPCLLKGLSFFHWAAFSPLSGVSWPDLCQCVSGLSSVFCWLKRLFTGQHHCSSDCYTVNLSIR